MKHLSPQTPEVRNAYERAITGKSLKRREWEEKIATNIFRLGGLIAVIFVLSIIIFLVKESYPLFSDPDIRNEVSLYHDEDSETVASIFLILDNLLANTTYQPVSDQPKFSLLPLAAGTFKITFIAVCEALFVSFLAAIAIVFYLPRKLKYPVKIITEVLAGIPTVVLGFLGLMFLATYLQNIFGYTYRLNAFLAGTVLSLTVIPIMTTLFEEVFNSFPKDQVMAAKCSGLFPYQIITRVIIPAVFGKIIAAVMLGFGRSFGETMIVLMVSGNAAILSFMPFDGARTFSATIGAEMAEVIFGDTHYSLLMLIGVILVLFTFVLNSVSQYLIRKFSYL